MRTGSFYKRLHVAGLLIWAGLSLSAQASVEDDFAAGVAAAQRHEYASALKYFESAAQAGMRKPLLYYNLGVSYYHERRLDKAEKAFRQAVQSPRLAALSYYNLGLIARDQGQREQAVNWFRQAEVAAQTQQMRRLSALALHQMTNTDPSALSEPAASWLVWTEGSMGYDSNVALNADFETQTGGHDETLGFAAYGYYDFPHLRVHGLINVEHYFTADDFNFDMLETGASLPLPGGDAWRFRSGLSVRQMQLAGEQLQNSAVLLLESTGQAAGFDLKFYLEHESITAADNYDYLSGVRSYLQASIGKLASPWRFICDIEFNQREDLSAAGEFFSFSPRRQQWQFEYKDRLTDNVNLRLAAGQQDSRYGDPDIRLDDIGMVSAEMQRKDKRERLVAELGYRHQKEWRSRIEWIYLKRDSSFTEFEYDRSVLMLRLERVFGD